MDQALYSLLRVNLKNLAKSKLYICKDWHIQPSEIDKLPYYEYEWMIEYINEDYKEQEKRSKEEQKQYDSMKNGMPNMNNIMKGYQQPTLPKISLPKLT
jgi:hypothetical protein